MKTNHRYRFVAGFVLGIFVLAALAWTPTERSFNNNQFGTNSFQIVIKNGARLTNILVWDMSVTGLTNSDTRDALVWADDKGYYREATMGSGVAFDIVTGTLSASGGSATYSAALHNTNQIADCGNGLTNMFYSSMTNHTWLRLTNVAVGQRITFRFYNRTLTPFQLYVGQNGGNFEWSTNTLHFGSGITAWMTTTNYTYGTAIGASNNCAHAVGWAPGGGFGGLF